MNYFKILCLLAAVGFAVCAQGAAAESPVLAKVQTYLRQSQLPQAEAVVRAYLKTHPNDAQALLQQAKIYRQLHQYDDAETSIRKLLAREPNHLAALVEASTIAREHALLRAFQGGSPDRLMQQAKDFCDDAAQLNGDDPDLLIAQGQWATDTGNDTLAYQKLMQAGQQVPQSLALHQALTRFYLSQKNQKAAKQASLTAIELDQYNAESYFLMAQLLSLSQFPDKAAEYAVRSEQLDGSRYPQRDQFLAQQFEKLGEPQKAIRYYEQLAAGGTSDGKQLLKLAQLHQQANNPEGADQLRRQAYMADPNLLTADLQSAYQLNVSGQTETARQQLLQQLPLLQEMLRQQPGQQGLYQGMMANHVQQLVNGVVTDYRQNKDTPDAVTTVITAFNQWSSLYTNPTLANLDQQKLLWVQNRQLTPALTTTLASLAQSADPQVSGEAYFLLKNYPQANQAFEAVDGLTAEGFQLAADRLLALRALDGADMLYKRGIAIKPLTGLQQGLTQVTQLKQQADERVTAGDSLFTAKNYDDAKKAYETAKTLYPEWVTPYLRLGDTYAQLKNEAGQYDTFKQAAAIQPSLLASERFAKTLRKLEKKNKP